MGEFDLAIGGLGVVRLYHLAQGGPRHYCLHGPQELFTSGGLARLLESVVLICGHCQGLLLHLRITFEKRQRWTLISIALDMICGKTKPTSGRVIFNDVDITSLTEHQIVRAGVGRKFQTPSVYEDLTVLENLEISLPHTHGVFQSLTFRRTPEVMDRIHAMAEKIYLIEAIHNRAGQLSHGQKQWLEIGMLLMQDSSLLLLDEPVAGMSPREREQTGDLLNLIAAGKSVIVIEHDMDFVKRIAHKVTVLHQGRLLSEGSVSEVKQDPRVIDVYLGH